MMLHTMRKNKGNLTVGELKKAIEMLDVPDTYEVIHQDLLRLFEEINEVHRDDKAKRLILREKHW